MFRIYVPLLLLAVFLTTLLVVPAHAQRKRSGVEAFTLTWDLLGPTERYLNTQSAWIDYQAEIINGRPSENKIFIEKQETNIDRQFNIGPTAIMNAQNTSVVGSQDVKIVGTQDAKDASVNATVNLAEGGDASSEASQTISHTGQQPPPSSKEKVKGGHHGKK